MIQSKIILDSINPYNGIRLTTMELKYPRFIHAEFMTHRVFSRNSASSRAIPIEKMLKYVKNDPAMPIYWGANKSGMSAEKEIDNKEDAIKEWLSARDSAVAHVENMIKLGLHKQVSNRILEPWFNITVILSATEFANFFRLRRHKDAQPEIKALADSMFETLNQSKPLERFFHLPYIQKDEEELEQYIRMRISVARCARVSYLTHDGKRDIQKDLDLFNHLLTGSGFGHFSPFEHVAWPVVRTDFIGNFKGWIQYRKTFENENA